MRAVALLTVCLAWASNARIMQGYSGIDDSNARKSLAKLLLGSNQAVAFAPLGGGLPMANPTRTVSRPSTLRTLQNIMIARKPIVGGNWKCNPEKMSELDGLIANINACDTSKCEVYVCPSPLHVAYCCGKFANGAMVCPQNCNFKGCGAYTGETAVEQMKDLGIEWCLIGHSERREYFNEDDALLASKLKYILDAGMKCVFAIGEKLEEREKGMDATMAVCIKQMEQIKDLLDPEKVVIAYEPVWAIGTGVTASPEQAQETHAEIRKWIAANVGKDCAEQIRIQYGGSANAANAPELSACPDIDGFLVGGASLKPEFADIVKAISAV